MARPLSDAQRLHRRRVAQAIGRGAQLIRHRGHCIGALKDDSGRLCLMGAIREAAKDEASRVKFDAYDEVNKRLRRAGHAIHAWNDEQTEGNVVADMLERVALEVDPSFTPLHLCWHGVPLGVWCGDCRHGGGVRPLVHDRPLCEHATANGALCEKCRAVQTAKLAGVA